MSPDFPGASARATALLLAQLETTEHFEVLLWIDPLEIIQQATAPADHHQHPASAGIILPMRAQVFGQRVDLAGQDRDLDFRRAPVRLAPLKGLDDFLFPLFGYGHLLAALPHDGRPDRRQGTFPRRADPISRLWELLHKLLRHKYLKQYTSRQFSNPAAVCNRGPPHFAQPGPRTAR